MGQGKGKTKFNAGAIACFRIWASIAVVAAAYISFGCGSADDVNSNSMAVSAKPNSNTMNSTSVNSTSTDLANANTNGNVVRPMDEAMKKMEQIQAAANKSGKQIPSLNSRPAPEDSTISSTLTDVARETRSWKKHPVLSKVEKIYDGGDGSIKVYLRNGKVIELPGKSITDVEQITAATVLSLAGVSTPVRNPSKKANPGN